MKCRCWSIRVLGYFLFRRPGGPENEMAHRPNIGKRRPGLNASIASPLGAFWPSLTQEFADIDEIGP